MSGSIIKSGLSVFCARDNAHKEKGKEKGEVVPDAMTSFYESLSDESPPMFEMRYRFPDPETGEEVAGEINYNVLSPSTCAKLAGLITRMDAPRPKRRPGPETEKPEAAKPPKDKAPNKEEERPGDPLDDGDLFNDD